jgi:hypothetical protein
LAKKKGSTASHINMLRREPPFVVTDKKSRSLQGQALPECLNKLRVFVLISDGDAHLCFSIFRGNSDF